MRKIIDIFKIRKPKQTLKIEVEDMETNLGTQKLFVNQFAENQNHQQRLFIQFLSSVLVVIVAYAFVYSNTASQKGINIYKLAVTDTSFKHNIVVNVKSEIFDTSKDENGSIISYSQLSLISIYVFAQIVLLILSIMILHMGYSFRRDQAVVNRIRMINLGNGTYNKIFGKKKFKGTDKGFFDYLPNFNSILYFSICIIQFALFISIFIYFKGYKNHHFYTIDSTYILTQYEINYKELRTSLIFPVLINIFIYTYYYNRYEFAVNNIDTYVPDISKFSKPKNTIWFSIAIICVCELMLLYSFYRVNKIIHLWTFFYFYFIILSTIIFYYLSRNKVNAASYSKFFQGLAFCLFGGILLYHSYYYFVRHSTYSMTFNWMSIIICFGSVGLFALTTFIPSGLEKETDSLFTYLKRYNRFLFVMLYVFFIVCFLKLKWLDYSVSCFFALYAILIGRRTLLEWRYEE